MSTHSNLLPPDTGERLKIARKSVGLTQAEAAAKVGVARTTLVAIEKGQRNVRNDELHQFSKIYDTTINSLLRRESVHVDLAPRFRRLNSSTETGAEAAVELMSTLARAEVEMECLLGIHRAKNYPPERPIMPGNARMQAEQDAAEFRQRLGLGIGPIPDIITLLEMELGVRVYVRKLDRRISGLFAYDDVVGPCILLNANHPHTRRAQTAAHECGHFVSTRRETEVLHVDEAETSREERYACAFGRALLTPDRGVTQHFRQVVSGSRQLTRRHVIVLAHIFGVSREAMVRRLEELKLVKIGTWRWFEDNGGITDVQARQVLGDLQARDSSRAEETRPTTLRLSLMVAEVYRRSLLSEGQLARLLQVSRFDIRRILQNLEMEEGPDDQIENILG